MCEYTGHEAIHEPHPYYQLEQLFRNILAAIDDGFSDLMFLRYYSWLCGILLTLLLIFESYFC